MLLKDFFSFMVLLFFKNPDNNNLISINGEQNTYKKLLGQLYILEKKKEKLEKTRQNKPKKVNC